MRSRTISPGATPVKAESRYTDRRRGEITLRRLDREERLEVLSEMCGLCGAFGVENHWTVAPSSMSDDVAERRRIRARRISLANRILAIRRLRVEDFQGSSYVLCSPTGRQEVVQDLGALWRLVEDMTGTALDPLDPIIVERLAT